MRSKKNLTLPALAFALLLTAGGALANGQPGSPAPGFSLDVHGGGTYALADGHGQVRIMFVIGFG